MTNPNYKCSQQELYTAALKGWASCLKHIAKFQAFKAKYKETLVETNLQLIKDAQDMPDDQARQAKGEGQRITLTKLADNCTDNWQTLKRYIADAFPADMQKTNLDAAGQQYYAKAANYNWENVQGLVSAGQKFIAKNLDALIANENMPKDFEILFNDNKKAFDDLHQQFLESEETAHQDTSTKIKANNEVYTALIAMFLDGQEIFKKDEDLKAEFVFESVLQLITGGGIAGIKGYITVLDTVKPVVGATISIAKLDKQATTDTDGKYQILQLTADTYNIKIGANGYETQVFENFEIKTGTVSNLNVALRPTT